MRLNRVYFCYGAILTSVLWLSVILIYFSVHETQLHHGISDGEIVDVFKRRHVISQSVEEVDARNQTLPLPDLDNLALVHSPEDKLLRADGICCILVMAFK